MPALNHALTGEIAAGADSLGLELPEATLLSEVEEVAPVLAPVVAHIIEVGHFGVAAALLGVCVVVSMLRVPYGLAGVEFERVALSLLPSQDGQVIGGGRCRVELWLGVSVSLRSSDATSFARRTRTTMEERTRAVNFMMSGGDFLLRRIFPVSS